MRRITRSMSDIMVPRPGPISTSCACFGRCAMPLPCVDHEDAEHFAEKAG